MRHTFEFSFVLVKLIVNYPFGNINLHIERMVLGIECLYI